MSTMSFSRSFVRFVDGQMFAQTGSHMKIAYLSLSLPKFVIIVKALELYVLIHIDQI